MKLTEEDAKLLQNIAETNPNSPLASSGVVARVVKEVEGQGEQITKADASLIQSIADKDPMSQLAQSGIKERAQSEVNAREAQLETTVQIQGTVRVKPGSDLIQTGVQGQSEPIEQKER